MPDNNKFIINFTGGVAPIGDIFNLLEAIKKIGVKTVSFTLRQELIFSVPSQLKEKVTTELEGLNLFYEIDKHSIPNIVSSYVAEEVFQNGNWITEGIYKDIFDSFEFKPKLKVNISDSTQSFTPFFSGHLNFISSDVPNFWYLYLRLPKTNALLICPVLIFTNEVSKICKFIENNIEDLNFENFESKWKTHPKIISLPLEKELSLPKFSLPYYEGLNRYGSRSWLGIYRRLEDFRVDFLLDLCLLAQKTKIGEFCITPWKSLIIKGIEENQRLDWSKVLVKYNINVRHAANELNWQIEDHSNEALALKNHLVNYFNRIDLRTFGICFGIKLDPQTEVFASIMVQRNLKKIFGIPIFKTYDISFTEDFDPNGRSKIYFDKNIPFFNLKEQLRRSVIFYHHKISTNDIINQPSSIQPKLKDNLSNKTVYQCNTCLSIYDAIYGDVMSNIPAGVIFENLPEAYCCGICGSDKNAFSQKSIIIKDVLEST